MINFCLKFVARTSTLKKARVDVERTSNLKESNLLFARNVGAVEIGCQDDLPDSEKAHNFGTNPSWYNEASPGAWISCAQDTLT